MSTSPYCKTCHKAGKSYAEYTNHWTRDKPGPDGKIVCPVILNTICGYCKEKGHWIKYCPAIKERNTKNVEDENYSAVLNVNSWANRLKQTIPENNTQNITFEPDSYSIQPFDKRYMNENIDVSVTYICDDEISENILRTPTPEDRPLSPAFIPPYPDYRPPSPDYPPPPHHPVY